MKVKKGVITDDQLFEQARESLLISGRHATNPTFLMRLLSSYMWLTEMPLIVLTGDEEMVRQCKFATFDPRHNSFHPMYGMSKAQICKLIRMAAEELGYLESIDQILAFALAVMEVSERQYVLGLPALHTLLCSTDDYIADLADKKKLPSYVGEVLRDNYDTGIIFRLIVSHLSKTFRQVAVPGVESYRNLKTETKAVIPCSIFYQKSDNQRLMNAFLKEELSNVMACGKKVRIIAEELKFIDENDELLQLLLKMKRLGKIELIVISEDASVMLMNQDLQFENVCLFRHRHTNSFERISEDALDGLVSAEDLAAVLLNWYGEHEKVAVKLKRSEDIVLVEIPNFTKGV